MGLVFGDNISYQGKKPLDARSLFNTLAEMKAYSGNYLPDLAMCQNKEDGKLYVYNSTNTVDATTGKWRVFTSGSTINKLEDIGDVTLTSIQKDQALLWDGAKWINGDVTTGGGSAGSNVISQLIDIQKVNIKAGPSSVRPLTIYTYTNNTNNDIYIAFNGIGWTDTGSNQGFLSVELDDVQFDKLILTSATNMDLIFTTKMAPGQVLTIKGDWTGSHSNCSWTVVGNLAVYAEAPVDLYYSIDRYSEDEICIGEYMGKPLYRKTYLNFKYPNTTNGTFSTAEYDVSALDIEEIIDTDVLWYNNGVWQKAMYITNANYQIKCQYSAVNKKMALVTNCSGLNSILVRCTLTYTKAGDVAGSFKPSMVTDNILLNAAPSYVDYNTDEIVVGKWTNGKPVYRKVIKVNDFSVTSTLAQIPICDLTTMNVDKVIAMSAIGKWNGTSRFCFPYVNVDSGITVTMQEWTDSNIVFNAKRNSGSTVVSDVWAIIEYTKTTDTVNSFTPDMIKTIPMNDDVTNVQVDEVLDILKGGK